MTGYDEFAGTLPYASELFGVYQPLLGWKSGQKSFRFDGQVIARWKAMVGSLVREASLRAAVGQSGPTAAARPRLTPPWLDSAVARQIQADALDLVVRGHRMPTTEEWQGLLSAEAVRERLDGLRTPAREALEEPGVLHLAELGVDLVPVHRASEEIRTSAHPVLIAGTEYVVTPMGAVTAGSRVEEEAYGESLAWLARTLPHLVERVVLGPEVERARKQPFIDPLADFDQDDPVRLAVLSPVGVVHIYREYFFELETFLGPPVGHVWISPGGRVELVEANTRRRLVERTMELLTETITRSELAAAEQDEIADAVREENQQDLKFGVTVSGGWNIGVAHAEASANFGFDTSHKAAQESTHRHLRQQSEKVSSEIRRNFKTTFHTREEITDTSSRRYVVQNRTEKLVNYELRRKMRKVGVQVQHVASQLCWEVYVDEPGMSLGLSELVHVARREDSGGAVEPPAAPVDPPQKVSDISVRFEFEGRPAVDPTDNTYVNGTAQLGFGLTHSIVWERAYRAPVPAPGYILQSVSMTSVERVDPDHDPASIVVPEFEIDSDNDASFTVRLRQVNFEEQPALLFMLKLVWDAPQLKKTAEERYEEQLKEFKAKQQREEKEEYITAVRERIKLASEIESRPSEDLREEERTVIFRRLIAQLMTVGGPEVHDHVRAELVRTLFDTDKMLYFVAPEWWRARPRYQAQVKFGRKLKDPIEQTESVGPEVLTEDEVIGWGGVGDQGRSNYPITEESEPARLGSSLGWLLQLDGDSRRNSFLNSPWVKAILPIRPGREKAALRWLQLAHVEGADGLEARYTGPEQELQGKTVGQALDTLAARLGALANDEQATLATEKVFESGFDPLEGGFRATGEPFEVFDQWIEILPTDQVAASEYDASAHR